MNTLSTKIQNNSSTLPSSSYDDSAVMHDSDLLDQVFSMLGSVPDYLEDRSTQPETKAIHQKWVIHIDDDYDLVNGLKTMMEARGIHVVHACDGVAGVNTVFKHPANAIILDFQMPNGRGDYVLARLKENPLTDEIPVIVLSGSRDQGLKQQLMAMGANAFVQKPYHFHELFELIQSFVD